jgi:TLC domain
MALYSPDLLPQQELDFVSRSLLWAIGILDQHGAWTWNLRYVAVATTIFLGGVRLVFHKKRGIDWYAFLHAIASASGAFACLYLDFVASERLTGIPEPLRSIQCHGPLTSLHRILPAITMGYSIFDLIDGLSISFDFVLHGAATMAVMALFIEVGAPHIMAPMLLMEGSTCFLTVVKADFFPDALVMLNQACFVFSFFLCRIVVVPYFWANLMMTMWQHRSEPAFQDCFPSFFMSACFFFGMFYNLLNGYWFTKIVKKARRRILGIEKHNEKNDLADEADRHIKKE